MTAEKNISLKKTEKRNAKRLKEISRWEKELQKAHKSNLRFYLIYLFFIVALVYSVDEIASQLKLLLQTEIANFYFAGGNSITIKTLAESVAVPFTVIGLLYRPLADKWGRKKFLVINTLGMSAGLFIMFLAESPVFYLVATCFIMFFIPHDMHVVYIMETAPAKSRAITYSLIKFVANMSVMAIPFLKDMLYAGNAGDWRNVCFFPAVAGVIIAFCALFFVREPQPFIEARLRYLRKTPEQLLLEKKEEKEKNAQGGFISALKFALRHKQLRWLYIVSAFVNLGFAGSVNFQAILSYGYIRKVIEEGVYMGSDIEKVVSETFVTEALFMFPVGLAFAQLVMGFIADKKSRKLAAVFTAANCLVSFILFSFGSYFAWPPMLTGLFCGLAIGSFYSTNDIIIMMVGESAPTNLRSSVAASQYIITAIGVGLSMGISILLTLNPETGNMLQAPVCFALFVPGFFIALWLLIKKTHDTTGIDLDTVTGEEWD